MVRMTGFRAARERHDRGVGMDMAQLRNRLRSLFAAMPAGVYELAARRLRGLHGDHTLVPGVARGRSFITSVAVAAAGAGEGGIARLCAGRDRHNRLVIVAEGRDMAVLKAVAAGAGVGREAVFRAGRSRHGGGIDMDMVQLRDQLCALQSAARAGMGPLAGFRLRGLHGDHTLVPVVTEGSGLAAGIPVAAAGAGIGCIALARAGRGGQNRLVIVSERRDLIACVLIAADSAGIGGKALFRAGRGGHSRLIRMAQGGGLIARVHLAASGAGIGRIALSGTCRGRHSFGVIVSQGRDFIAHIPVAAA